MTVLVPISWGELLDKITILEIKSERLTSPAGLANVRHELQALCEIAAGIADHEGRLAALKAALKTSIRRFGTLKIKFGPRRPASRSIRNSSSWPVPFTDSMTSGDCSSA